MKSWKVWCVLGALLGAGLLLAGCGILTEITVRDINACTTEEECVLVDANFCGGTTAINAAHLEEWNRYLKIGRLKHPNVMCAPSLPRDWFEARCLQFACRALQRNERAYLEFADRPLLNTPASLSLHFRFAEDVTDARARIEFIPEGLEVLRGSPQWQGSLKAGEDGLIQVTLKVTQPGYYQVIGVVEADKAGQKVWLEDRVYVEVSWEDAVFGSQSPNEWGRSQVAIPVDDDRGLIQSELVITPEPALGEEFTLTYRVTPRIDLSHEQVYMLIGVPQEFAALNETQMVQMPLKGLQVVKVVFPPYGESFPDSLAWRGALSKGQTVEIKVTFKVLAAGWGYVYGNLNLQAGGALAQFVQDTIVVEIHVDQYGGYVVEVVP
jgi:hypothetical protein